MAEQIYDIKNSKISKPEDENQPQKPAMPQISHKQADEIIAGLNKQFEEKILKPMREKGQGSEPR